MNNKVYVDLRMLGCIEAAWRLYGYEVMKREPVVPLWYNSPCTAKCEGAQNLTYIFAIGALTTWVQVDPFLGIPGPTFF